MTDLTFAELNLSQPILQALTDMGFEEPTPVQEKCIPPLLQQKDVVGQAQTGTGKTAAFGIPLVQQTDISIKEVQTIIMCPTRELAIQVTGELIKIGKHLDGLHVVPVYGGQSISRQIKALKRGAHVVVGTPGRTIDHLRRGTMKLDHLQRVVFDEADEMLNMGFRDDMEQILSYASQPVQTIMFSATMSKGIRKIMNRYMDNPETVAIERKKMTAPNIEQYVVEVRDSVRTEAICRFMDINDFKLALVFCNTKRKTEKVSRELRSRGYSSDFINGDLSQNQRDRVMGKFRSGAIDILVGTDVAARGLDIDDIEAVFNYDIPQDPEYYVHRIGRTGRAGRSGMAITFSTKSKKKQLRTIERQIKNQLNPLDLPSTADVQKSRLAGEMDGLVEVLEKGNLRPFIDQIESFTDDRFTTVEIAAALLKKRTEAPDQQEEAAGENGQSQSHNYDDSAMVRMHFNVGKKNNVYPGDLVGAIAGESNVPGNVIGNIDIFPHHSFVDIPGKHVKQVLDIMNRNRVKGKKIRVKVA
ncbi:ATP-dependent RNA helicase DeaD [Fodinibius roseus]|uniref:DEAD-box ATP-dependent RNA helicase RhpA n=1 Tax=Fodinibius roseus TaxID=1194090 RepID=A0A1M5DXX4_9BACT|nr:DEAD/DEAH box helicase [Fodinibius roseus]SHF71819.1 ATP-dependent RNA helicase DeaD [Fodinibius roseus]